MKIMNNKYIGSGQPWGYGYIQMARKSEGQTAVISLQEKSLRGRVIEVVEALPLSDSEHAKPSLGKRDKHPNMKKRQR